MSFMKTLFLDESGDLGFKSTSSKHFVITIIVCDELHVKRLRKISKRVRTRKLKRSYKLLAELKANNSNDKIRTIVLKQITSLPVEVYSIILDKRTVYEYLKSKKHQLYNYIANLIISECSITDKKAELIVDNRRGSVLAREFTGYILKKFKERDSLRDDFVVGHIDSKNDGGLQMVDFVSWAIFRKYEYNDLRFYDIVKSHIVHERSYGP